MALFANLVESSPGRSRERSGYPVPLSLAVHASLVTAVVLVPLLSAGEVPDPAASARAFFVEPVVPPPAPPPPPPRANGPARRGSTAPRATPATFVAPVQIPDVIAPGDVELPGAPDGVPGVDGGVFSDSTGPPDGIVTGLPSAPSPPAAPVRIGDTSSPRRR
jgi:hypothetical protein